MDSENKKIILPRENKKRVSALRRKLKEYAERVDDYKKRLERENPSWHPKLIELSCGKSEHYIRLAILSELLYEGEVSLSKLCSELESEGIISDGRTLDDFFGSYLVINDYCETGGANCVGGTGLK